MSRDQNQGRSHSIKINRSFEMLEDLKYLGKSLRIYFYSGRKSRLKSGNARYYSVQILLSSSLQSKNIKIKIYRTLILFVVFYG